LHWHGIACAALLQQGAVGTLCHASAAEAIILKFLYFYILLFILFFNFSIVGLEFQ
jgi:hypothetical protein